VVVGLLIGLPPQLVPLPMIDVVAHVGTPTPLWHAFDG
jgi:hypothetical protein